MSRQFTIAELNDLLRQTFLTGRVILTHGINSLSAFDRGAIIIKVREFSDFNDDNDPYDEHDFGAFDLDGVGEVFWKIDYYGQDNRSLSPDPSNPHLTRRVLTIMLAEEY